MHLSSVTLILIGIIPIVLQLDGKVVLIQIVLEISKPGSDDDTGLKFQHLGGRWIFWKFKVNLVYRVSSKTGRAEQRNSVSKTHMTHTHKEISILIYLVVELIYVLINNV